MSKALAKSQSVKSPATLLEAVIDSLHSAASQQPGLIKDPPRCCGLIRVANGDRWNDCYVTNAFKQAAREKR